MRNNKQQIGNKMNIIKDLLKRIEDRRVETKNPCKSYATEESADKINKAN